MYIKIKIGLIIAVFAFCTWLLFKPDVKPHPVVTPPAPQVFAPVVVEPKPQDTPKALPDKMVYSGTWNTQKRFKLNGTMTCILTKTGVTSYTGKFDGEYLRSPYSYTANFTGLPSALHGENIDIDGATYSFDGTFNEKEFNGKFTSSRYTGSFELKKTDAIK